METTAELLNIDTVNVGDVPTLDILTEMDGNLPIPNFPNPSCGLLLEWGWEAGLFPADNDGLF